MYVCVYMYVCVHCVEGSQVVDADEEEEVTDMCAHTHAHTHTHTHTHTQVVAADEKETHDIRATLNLGHTFGHAIETGTGYHALLHGEAVAIGMLMAADMSYRLVSERGRDLCVCP